MDPLVAVTEIVQVPVAALRGARADRLNVPDEPEVNLMKEGT